MSTTTPRSRAPLRDTDGYAPERRWPFLRSLTSGGRVLSALAFPAFSVLPLSGYGVLTTTGRRTGKARRKCIRAIRERDRAYIVSIAGSHAAWLKNVRTHPNVRLRLGGGTYQGVARELRDEAETQQAMAVYCGTVDRGDYLAYALHRRGRPTRAKVEELTRTWFEQGIPLVIDLIGQTPDGDRLRLGRLRADELDTRSRPPQ